MFGMFLFAYPSSLLAKLEVAINDGLIGNVEDRNGYAAIFQRRAVIGARDAVRG